MNQKRIHIILATTLFASLLWVSVNLGNTYQTQVAVPLRIIGLPPAMAMQAPVPRTLRLKLRGDGWQLAAMMLGAAMECTVDLTSLPQGQTAITLPDVAERLGIPGVIQALDMYPDSIMVAFDSLAERRVPVELNYAVTFRDRYGQVGAAVAIPESVTLRGARSVLAMIGSWPTLPSLFEDLKDPIDIPVRLAESDRYQIDVEPREVRMRMDVQWFAEKVFTGVPVEVTSVPPHREVILVPPRIELVVRGGVGILSGVDIPDIQASLDYGQILSDTTGMLAPVIEAPAGLQIIGTRPERLQYIVRKRL
jgi:hypothetical protein